MHHYMSMTLNNWRTHMQPEQVKPKKYFYILRPILCCRWLEAHGSVPPIQFETLCKAMLPVELEATVSQMLLQKQITSEKDLIDHIPEMDAFLLAEMDHIHEVMRSMDKVHFADYEHLNALFRQILRRAWQSKKIKLFSKNMFHSPYTCIYLNHKVDQNLEPTQESN